MNTATSAAQLPSDLEALMRSLRLPHARAIAADVLATARAQRWDPTEVIKALLAEETAGRARSMLASRRKAAGFPTGKTFDVWDENTSSIPLPTQHALRTLEWVQRRENLVVCGPAGTGKTFFLEALGQKVIEAGMPVAWFTLEQIGVLVRAHRADDSLGKAVAKIVRAELVVIDDVGLLAVGADAAEGLYRIVEAAYERKSVAISSNLHPSGFDELMPKTFGDGHRRPPATPRSPLPDQRRLRATGPSTARERSQTLDLTPQQPPVAATPSRADSCPPLGNS